jgi:hypothetical protein
MLFIRIDHGLPSRNRERQQFAVLEHRERERNRRKRRLNAPFDEVGDERAGNVWARALQRRALRD